MRALRSLVVGFNSLKSVGHFGIPVGVDESFTYLVSLLTAGLALAAEHEPLNPKKRRRAERSDAVRELRTEIDIDAPPERVWDVLMDFDAYPAWNPFITSLSGEARSGAKLTARLEPPGGRGMTFKPAVVRAEPSVEFRWLGHFLVPRVFDGEHIFELHPSDGGTHFVQREEFGGLLVAPMLRWIGANTRRGFEEMNQALKERVEAGS